MKPFSTILLSTSLRRSMAACGLRNGLYCEGACGRPARSADSCSSRSRACLLKKVTAAASTPMAVRPPTVPNGTELRYWCRIQVFERRSSSSEASLASRIFRLKLRCGSLM